MLKDPKNVPSDTSKTPLNGGVFDHAPDLKPWEDQSLAPKERREAYRDFIREKLEAIRNAFDRAREVSDVATQKEIMNSPETKRWIDEAQWLEKVSVEEFCDRSNCNIARELLGKNFLGAQAWESHGIDVGPVPPLPAMITKALLNSECPLHPGEKIKDTHLLVLIPETVNGEAYSPVKLNELCATRKGSGSMLMYDGQSAWKGDPWASVSQTKSEWLLIPKSDPDPEKSPEKHFRSKTVMQQQEVHEMHYKDYREAKAVEIMTAVLLYDLTHKERLLGDYLRCQEPDAFDGRVCLTFFYHNRGLEVCEDLGDNGGIQVGRALVRKS